MIKHEDLCFSDIKTILEEASLFTSAAETHGILSGIACGGGDLKGQAWKSDFNDIVNGGEGLSVAAKELVDVLYANVVKQCVGDSLNFKILLPDDALPIAERVEALAHWTQGFLVGFGMVQQELNKAAAEIQDLIRDIRDISQLVLDFDGEDEGSEIAYVEIVEYLRLGGMFCFDYFSSDKVDISSQKLH
jgi:uncharacterized protein YgfB (UPF0149 family)